MTETSPTATDIPAGPYWGLDTPEATAAFRALIDASLQEVPADRRLEIASDSTTHIYFVRAGWLIVSKSTLEGHRQIVDFLLPGQILDPGSAQATHTSTDLSTLTDATLALIPRADWARLPQDHPSVQAHFDRRLAASYSRIAERMLRLGQGRAETRIAHALCELRLRSTELGLVEDAPFHIPLTRQVLGDFAGLSSVHVSRTFRRLRRQGLMSHGDHMDIVIHDIDRLAEIAEIDPVDLRRAIIATA